MTATGRLWLPGVVGVAALLMWRRSYVVAARDRAMALRARQPARSLLNRVVGRWLDAAMVPVSVSEAVQAWLLCAVGLGVFGGALRLPFLVACGVATLCAGPGALWARRHRCLHARADAAPELLRTVAAELRAGGTVGTGCAAVAKSPSPLASDMATFTSRLSLGASLEGAAAIWVGESGIAAARAVAAALTLAHEVGGPAAEALDGLASSLAARIDVQHERRAQSAQARMSAWVVILAPFGYLAFAAFIDQGALSMLFNTAVGRICLGLGVGLDLLALWWIRVLIGHEVPV